MSVVLKSSMGYLHPCRAYLGTGHSRAVRISNNAHDQYLVCLKNLNKMKFESEDCLC
jgi:hypothetical protein